MTANQAKAIFFILFLIALGVAVYYIKPEPATPPDANKQTISEIPATLEITVKGAVRKPGLYSLPVESSISEVINCAGGLCTGAILPPGVEQFILTEPDTIIIPFAGTPIHNGRITLTNDVIGNLSKFMPVHARTREQKTDSRININTATEAELKTLPRIGDKTAAKIIDYRNTTGGFKNIEEIMNVPRIGEKTFDLLQDKIRVE